MYDDVIELITEDRAYEAIQLLKARIRGRKALNTLANIEGRLNNLNSRIARGVIGSDAAALERNQIRDALVELMRPSEPESKHRKTQLPLFLGGIIVALMALLGTFYFLVDDQPAPIACVDHKIAIRVADFLDKEAAATDPFTSSIMTEAVNRFGTTEYDISGVGVQAREANYHEKMLDTYFNRLTTCDTSGLLLNGVLSPEYGVFNVWMTLANLPMHNPYLEGRSELSLSNPPSIEFSMPEDAKFIVDLAYAILMNSKGEPLSALETLLSLEKSHHEIIAENPNLGANIAFVKGNAYALRGDNERAKAQYDVAAKKGSAELSTIALANNRTAERMKLVMVQDPEVRKIVIANKRKHLTFEQELARFFRSIGKVIDDLFRARSGL